MHMYDIIKVPLLEHKLLKCNLGKDARDRVDERYKTIFKQPENDIIFQQVHCLNNEGTISEANKVGPIRTKVRMKTLKLMIT